MPQDPEDIDLDLKPVSPAVEPGDSAEYLPPFELDGGSNRGPGFWAALGLVVALVGGGVLWLLWPRSSPQRSGGPQG